MVRAVRIHGPTVRRTPGSSFGPMAISATTAMTTSSLHPISNMNNSAHARRLHTCPKVWAARVPTGLAVVCRKLRCSDRLAPDVRPRCRRLRGVVVDGLHGLGLFRSLLLVLHALLERLDALRDIAHEVRYLAATKQQQDDCDHDDPVPNAKRTHPATLQTHGQGDPARSQLKVGSGGVKNKDLGRVKIPLQTAILNW